MICILIIFPVDLWHTMEFKSDVAEFFTQKIIFKNVILFVMSSLVGIFVLLFVYLITTCFPSKPFIQSKAFLREGISSFTFEDAFLLIIHLSIRLWLFSHLELMNKIATDSTSLNQTVNQYEKFMMDLLMMMEGTALFWLQLIFDMIFVLYQHERLVARKFDIKVPNWRLMLVSLATIFRFHIGTATLGAFLMLPLIIVNVLKLCFKSMKQIPTFLPNLYYVCAVKGTNFIESARIATNSFGISISKNLVVSTNFNFFLNSGVFFQINPGVTKRAPMPLLGES